VPVTIDERGRVEIYDDLDGPTANEVLAALFGYEDEYNPPDDEPYTECGGTPLWEALDLPF
jgi:hypothetical protein